MSAPLIIAVSPYHMTTREAPAVAALQLADSVVTLLPAPPDGRTRDDVERAVQKCPRYLRLLDSWRWTIPLWNEGVVSSAHDENEVSGELHASYELIGQDDEYAGLRPLMKHAVAAKPDQFLDLLCADILKGGPDPALNIPVSATLDAFASRHGMFVARAAPTSIAQRAEAHLGQRLFAVAIPVLLHASARLILRVREELAKELTALRAALIGACINAGADEKLSQSAQASIQLAAKAYTAEFESIRPRLEGRDDDQGVRIVTGYVSVSAMVLPANIAMRSGLAAARSMNMRGMAAAPRNGQSKTTQTAPERLVVLVIKPLNARPDVER